MDSAPTAGIRVLLAEDDGKLAALVAEYLDARGFRVTHVGDGSSALVEARTGSFDAIVLDVGLPGRDGIAVCRTIRQESDVPILFLTARAEESDRVLGLEIGGDDYVVKPFSSRELAARLHALVRRTQAHAGGGRDPIRAGSLELDPVRRVARRHGRALELTTREFDLLRLLMERRGRVLRREQLVELLHGAPDETFDRAIDVAIFRLRQKLDDPHAAMLKTVRGVGYVLAPDEDP